MRYAIAAGVALGALQLACFASPVAAQSSAPLDSFSLGGVPQSTPNQPQTLDKIVAVVNDGVILESELDAAVAGVRQRAGDQVAQVPDNVLRSQVLDQLIMRRLEIQRAHQDNLKVSDDELNRGLARIAQKNHMDMQQFVRAVSASGMSMATLRDHVRQEILISKLHRTEVMNKVVITDDDVDRYLENQSLRDARHHEYHLRQIMLKSETDADATTAGITRDRMHAIRKQIVDGTQDFAAAARADSQGPHAADGGDLGWMSGANLPVSFENALNHMQPGDVSPVFHGQGGFYLIKLEDERGGQNQDDSQKVMVHEVQARHILLKPNEIRDDQRTQKLARQILERLDAGDDFAALARKYSDDSATANQGGDLGWVQPDGLDPTTRRQIESLQAGQVSPIFQTADGYEIIKVEKRRERDATEQARRNKAREALGEQRSNEQGELWLRKLRDEAYVDIRMPDYQPEPDH